MKYGPHKTDEELLQILCGVSEHFSVGHLSRGQYLKAKEEMLLPGLSTYRNRFGSFAKARKMAGLNPGSTKRIQPAKSLYPVLLDMTERLGHFPLVKEYLEERQENPALPSLYSFTHQQKWSVWRDRTLKRAGTAVPNTKRRDRAIAKAVASRTRTLRSIADQYGITYQRVAQIARKQGVSTKQHTKIMTARRIERLLPKAYRLAAQGHLGTEAYKTLGISDKTFRLMLDQNEPLRVAFNNNRVEKAVCSGRQVYSNQDMLDHLVMADRLNPAPFLSIQQYAKIAKQHGLASAPNFIRRFGSWSDAKRQAGLAHHAPHNRTKITLEQALRDLQWAQDTRAPYRLTHAEYFRMAQRHNLVSLSSLKNLTGGFSEAMGMIEAPTGKVPNG